MPLIVFLALFAACIGLWSLGAPAWLVFLVALLAWVAFYAVLYPKVRAYKAAMGFDDRLTSLEVSGWHLIALHLKGLKVIVFGFVTSMVPFVGAAAQWISGQNINFFFDPHNPKAQQTVMFIVGAIVFATPFLTTWLHSGALSEAAETEPAQTGPAQIGTVKS